MAKRRTQEEMDVIRQAIVDALEEDAPMTVRQVFYRLTVQGVVPKQERRGYQTVQRLLVEMRDNGDIDYDDIVDSSRTIRAPDTFDSIDQALYDATRQYRRSLWTGRDEFIQVWIEKEALAGVVWDVTDRWDVQLWVNRGFASLSYLNQGAQWINKALSKGKRVFIYNMGDHDPSGVGAWDSMKDRLVEWIDDVYRVEFERIAVTPWQIREWSLPSRPTKQSDSRSKGFDAESVEMDAIMPRQLRRIVENAILRHVSLDELERTMLIEEAERESAREYMQQWQ